LRIGYVRQIEKIEDCFKKEYNNTLIIKIVCYIKYYLIRKFNITKEKMKYNDVYNDYYLIPKIYGNRNRIRKNENIAINLYKKLNNNQIKTVVLSECLNKNNEFKNILHSKNINILNGRILFKVLIPNIIEYICKIREENIEKKEVTLLVNDLNEINIYLIKKLAKTLKVLNIVSNNTGKFKKIEKDLYEEMGIVINISNNKRKSLKNSNIIINVDFVEEMLNKYNINREAIIVNVEEKINIGLKSYKGINVNYYEFSSEYINSKKKDKDNEEEKHQNIFDEQLYFNINKLYESLFINNIKLDDKLKEKIQDDIDIVKLIGNNGEINEVEFKQIEFTKKS